MSRGQLFLAPFLHGTISYPRCEGQKLRRQVEGFLPRRQLLMLLLSDEGANFWQLSCVMTIGRPSRNSIRGWITVTWLAAVLRCFGKVVDHFRLCGVRPVLLPSSPDRARLACGEIAGESSLYGRQIEPTNGIIRH